MQGNSEISLRTSLSAVLAALRDLETLHNRRRVRQVTNARSAQTRGAAAAPRDVFLECTTEGKLVHPRVVAPVLGRDMTRISAPRGTLSLSPELVRSGTRPCDSQEPETGKNDPSNFSEARDMSNNTPDLQCSPGDTGPFIENQRLDCELLASWTESQASLSWMINDSIASRDISSWLFSSDICPTFTLECDEFRPQSTSTPRKTQIGATCPSAELGTMITPLDRGCVFLDKVMLDCQRQGYDSTMDPASGESGH
ncbi:hypothetical protein B0H10DRAFT_2194326 [Mycena sp. CBHHK59/15]|nr:hypothetical protein B0H10DRAFT_2194326 [Mycena sp. CBHHK59/15]